MHPKPSLEKVMERGPGEQLCSRGYGLMKQLATHPLGVAGWEYML